jgi:hypothetical protein
LRETLQVGIGFVGLAGNLVVSRREQSIEVLRVRGINTKQKQHRWQHGCVPYSKWRPDIYGVCRLAFSSRPPHCCDLVSLAMKTVPDQRCTTYSLRLRRTASKKRAIKIQALKHY